jgi:acetyl-CoA carboxylase carboxyltransferase component
MSDGSDSRLAEDKRRRDARRLLEHVLEEKQSVSDEGRPEAVKRQHEQGKLTARERVEYFCDEGSFDEIGQLAAPAMATPEMFDWSREDAPADGVVVGIGEVDDRTIGIAATDFTVKGGSIGHTTGEKIHRVMDIACRQGFPVVMLWEGGGHRIQEGLDARPFAHGDNGTFDLQAKMSGWVPMVSAMMGPGFAGPTNYAAMCDFVPMVEGSTLGIAGPKLVKAALGHDLDMESYGSPHFHTVETGMADLTCADDEECLDTIQQFLSYLPSNAKNEPPKVDDFDGPYKNEVEELLDVVPAEPKKGYDVHDVITGIVDQDSFFELKPRYARNIVTGFARLRGRSIGIVANNPRIMAGTLDVPASDKGSHFISMCDAFNIPLVFLTDIPGVLPGPDSEREGIARHSGKFVYEIGRATVPTVNVVLRRGYGIGYLCMAGGRSTDNELTVVWPTAEIAAMSIEGAVDIVYREQINNASDPEAKREELIEKFTDRTGAIRAAEGMGIDAVIDPRETRERVARALERSESNPNPEDLPPKHHSINPI